MPMTIDCTPFNRSAVQRTAKQNPGPPNSARYTPPKNPTGTPKTIASSSSFALPTIALAMPPPVSPTGAGSLVKKSQLRLRAPWTNRYPRMNSRVPAANSVQNAVSVSIAAFTAFRRSRFQDILRAPLAGRGKHQQPRRGVDRHGQSEQNQSEFDQRALIQRAGGFREFVGDHRGDRVSRREQRRGDLRRVAHHHRHRHGFPQRPRQRQKNRSDNSLFGVRHDDIPGHLPAGGAQRQGGFALLRRNRQHDLPRDGDDERQDHDRQHDARRQQAYPVKRTLE